MVVLKHKPGMRVWHPPYVSQEDPYSGGMRDYDPSADPYGWVGDPSAASDDQAKLLATVVEEVRPLPVIGHCFHCKEKREIVDSTVTFNKTGVPITQGKCSTCGGAISRLGRMK